MLGVLHRVGDVIQQRLLFLPRELPQVKALEDADVATHPVAFSAVGSHASYWRAGEYESVFRISGRPRLTVFDEAIACPDCPEWRTWENLLDAKVQPWYGFGGAWGSVTSSGGFNGPLGPSRYKSGTDSPLETVRQAETPVTGPPPD